MRTQHFTRRTLVSGLLLFLGFSVISVLWTSPFIADFSERMVGTSGDRYIFLWNIWWVKKALFTEGVHIIDCPWLFHPMGSHLAFHSLSLLNCLVGVALMSWFSLLEIMNLLTFLCFPLAALSMYYFCRSRGCSPSGSFLGGTIFAFWTGHWAHYEQLNMMTTYWIPVYLTVLHRWLDLVSGTERTSWRVHAAYGAVLGLSWTVNCYSCLYYGAYLILYSCLAVFWPPRFRLISLARIRGFLTFMLCAILVAAGLLLPLYYPVLDEVASEVSDKEDMLLRDTGIPVQSLLVPQEIHRVWNRLFRVVRERFPDLLSSGYASTVFPGFLVVFLAVIGLVSRRLSDRYLFIVVGVFFLSLSFGTALQFGGKTWQLPMPIELLTGLPGFAFLRVSSRAMIMVMLVMALLAAAGVDSVLKRCSTGIRRVCLPLMVMIVLGEYYPGPLPTMPLHDLPRFYRTVSSDSPGAILDLGDRAHEARKSLLFQTYHEKPLTQGFVAHPSKRAFQVYHLYAAVDRLLEERSEPFAEITVSVDDTTDGPLLFHDLRGNLAGFLSSLSISHVALANGYWVMNKPRAIRALSRELGPPVGRDGAQYITFFAVPTAEAESIASAADGLEGREQAIYIVAGNGFVDGETGTGNITARSGATIMVVNQSDLKGLVMQFTARDHDVARPRALIVNGVSYYFHSSSDDEGTFTANMPLRPGLNLLELSASAHAAGEEHSPGTDLLTQKQADVFIIGNLSLHFLGCVSG